MRKYKPNLAVFSTIKISTVYFDTYIWLPFHINDRSVSMCLLRDSSVLFPFPVRLRFRSVPRFVSFPCWFAYRLGFVSVFVARNCFRAHVRFMPMFVFVSFLLSSHFPYMVQLRLRFRFSVRFGFVSV